MSSLFLVPDFSPAQPRLSPEETHHALRVLRLRPGDALTVANGRGDWWAAHLADTNVRGCALHLEGHHHTPPPAGGVQLAIAPTKATDRLEYCVEKCVEIGVTAFHFVDTERTERKHLHLERLGRVVASAFKQSRKAYLPALHPFVPLAEWLAHADLPPDRFVAHLADDDRQTLWDVLPRQRPVCVLIGPEGDFSPAEIAAARAADFRPVSLGQSRLRTDTAGVVAVHTVALRQATGE